MPTITSGSCSGPARWAPTRSARRRRRSSSSPQKERSLAPGEVRAPGYEWPSSEHGIYVDPKGFVWIGGNGTNDHQILKFTRDGKFVMQIGRAGKSRGNADTENLNQPADTFVHAATNELFVADGYGNRRIIVFDADTGGFKRMWGAFGNTPTDDPPNPAPARCRPAGRVAVRAAGSRRARLEGRSRLRVGSRRQARAGVHGSMAPTSRRCSSDASARRPSAATEHGREHGVLHRCRAAVPVSSATAARPR